MLFSSTWIIKGGKEINNNYNHNIKEKKKMSVWYAATQLELPGAIPRLLNTGDSLAAPRGSGCGLSLVRANRPNRTLAEGTHMNVELMADAKCASNPEHEYSQPKIILDIWPPSSWITGARHDSQPTTNSTLSALYCHGNRFTVSHGVNNWYLFSQLWCRLLNLIKTVQIMCKRHILHGYVITAAAKVS